MNPGNTGLNFFILESIEDIPHQAWDNLFGDIIEGYGFQKTLEKSRLSEFSFGYLVGKRADVYVLIMPFFVMDFSFAMLARGWIKRFIQSIQKKFCRFLRMKVLFLGMLTAEEFYLGASAQERLEQLLEQALDKLEGFSKKQGIYGIAFNNVSLKNEKLIAYLKRKEFVEMETLPTTLIQLDQGSFEGYLERLSKNSRKDLKRKLRKVSSLVELSTSTSEDICDQLDEVYRLYMNNFSDADVHFEILTPEFFHNITRNMPGVAKYFLTYAGDKLVAFNLCFIKNGICIDKFIGFDTELAYKYHLYFTTFAHNIDWCLKNSIRRYQPGVSDYFPKVRLGAKLLPLYIYSRGFNGLINLALKLSARFIEPKKLDPSLAKIGSQNLIEGEFL